MPDIGLDAIELATLVPAYPGPGLISGLGVEETWKGEVYAESGPTVAYFKMLEPEQVISEVVCAILGRALGLNVPKPLLVYVERQNLSASQKWKANEDQRVCFGSEDAKCPSFKQVIKSQPTSDKLLFEKLVQWNGFKRTAWFDEWTANIDRHIGNVLYDGVDFWLIDHGHAFTGPAWVPADLIAEKQVANRLLNAKYIGTFDAFSKEEWKGIASAESLRYQGITLAELREAGMMDEYSSDGQQKAIINFLTARAASFINLACDRLGVPRPLI